MKRQKQITVTVYSCDICGKDLSAPYTTSYYDDGIELHFCYSNHSIDERNECYAKITNKGGEDV